MSDPRSELRDSIAEKIAGKLEPAADHRLPVTPNALADAVMELFPEVHTHVFRPWDDTDPGARYLVAQTAPVEVPPVVVEVPLP